jgi:mannose-1-phosphate guanylyltransferase
MIAQLRPSRDLAAIASLRHLWGVLLPHNERPRPAALSRRHDTGHVERADSLARPLERASRLIPGTRLVTVLTRDAVADARGELAGVPGLQRYLEPASRGTAPEMFLAAFSVLQQDPHAVVAALPVDHLADDGRLMHYVARAAGAAAVRPELPIIVAASGVARDPEYAWIEAGDPVEGLEAFAVRAVRRVVAQPSAADRASGMLGTLAVVTAARTLIALGRRHLPEVLECLEPLEDVVGGPEATLLCDAVWESMPRASLFRDLLAHVPQLGVVSIPDAMALAS